MPARLQVQDLKKVYHSKNQPSLRAVDGVSFEVHAGECLGLLGPNGAGKSTTMKCVTGFFEPSAGHVLIEGVDVHQLPKVARKVLGVCSQEDTLDTDFTVLDQMIQFASFFGIKGKTALFRSQELLDRFGLESKSDELIEALSGGMRRRLQVARALIHKPTLLVLDEPTTGLDPEARRVLWEILAEQRREGLAILLSTHYMEEAERLCDRVAILHQGRILKLGTPQELISKEIGNELMQEEVRPGVLVRRPPNLEDVYLKLTGARLT